MSENIFVKIFLATIFSLKFFLRIFFLKNIFGKNIFDKNIFGNNIFFGNRKGTLLSLPAIHLQHTTPTPSHLLPLIWSWGGGTNKRTYGSDGAHNDCSFYCIRLKCIYWERFLTKIFLLNCFYGENILDKNIFIEIFGKNIFSKNIYPHLTAIWLPYKLPHLFSASHQRFLKLSVTNETNKRNHGPDAHTYCLFYCIR